MTPDAMMALVARAEEASTADRDFVADLLSALDISLDATHPVSLSALVSLEAAVAEVDRALPRWRITLERSSRWRCTLRESAIRDDDELIGVAVAPTPAVALLAASLVVAARRARGYR